MFFYCRVMAYQYTACKDYLIKLLLFYKLKIGHLFYLNCQFIFLLFYFIVHFFIRPFIHISQTILRFNFVFNSSHLTLHRYPPTK